MINEIKEDPEKRMKKTIESLERKAVQTSSLKMLFSFDILKG